jgi:hypothetical protein
MKQIVIAGAVAALTLVAVPVAQAAPMAPLPSSSVTTVGHGNLVQVQWWWHNRRWGHRRCWRGRFGRLHCRYW